MYKRGVAMNKIYKVVWNKARGMYVVASEFAKSHTKSSGSSVGSSKGMKLLSVLAVAATLSVWGDMRLKQYR